MEEKPNQEAKVETEKVEAQNQQTPPVIAEVPEESVAIPQKSIVLFPTVILLVVVSVFAGSLLYQNRQLKSLLKINSFDECTKANGVIQESYPPVCVTKDGRRFTKEVGQEEKTNSLLPTTTPETDQEIKTTTQTISVKYSPKPEWKTYTDKVAGFSIQYNPNPSGDYNFRQLTNKQEEGKGVKIISCHTPLSGPSAGKEVCNDQLTINVYTNYKGTPLKEWHKNAGIAKDCKNSYAEIMLDDQKGLLLTNNDCNSWGESFVLIPNNDKVIVLHYLEYSLDEKNGKITIGDSNKELLSTFHIES